MSEDNFHGYVNIKSQLAAVNQNHFEYMEKFWNDSTKGFNLEAKVTESFRLTSTCFSIVSLLNNPRSRAEFLHEHGKDVLGEISEKIFQADWTSEGLDTFNTYTTPIVIDVLYQINPKVKNKKIDDGIKALLDVIEKHGASKFGDYPSNPYLTYWAARALFAFYSNNSESELSGRVLDALKNVTRWSESVIHGQIAAFTSGDSDNFDPIQFSYVLSIYTHYCPNFLDVKENQKIVKESIRCIFKSQQKNGLWSKSNPIFVIPNIGNVYPFAFEMLDVLFSLPSKYAKVFTSYLDNLQSIIDWIPDNLIYHKEDGRDICGWRSNHIANPKGSPVSWSTAVVFNTIFRIQRFVALLLNETIVREFNGNIASLSTMSGINEIKDCNVMIKDQETRLKDIILENLINPRIKKESHEEEKEQLYSAIFFGPPGTSKTKWATAIASALGWNFIKFQSGDFLTEGIEKATSRARYIFDRLNHLKDTVILFDEIEEFVKSRELDVAGNPPDLFNRMLTTSMLTLISDLRSKKKTIFIVATNYLDEFDSAVKRPGRFDMVLLVGPPNKKSMKEIASELKVVGKINKDIDLLVVNKVIDDEYVGRLEYFIFNEWVSLLNDLSVKIKEGLELGETEKTLREMIKDDSRSIILSEQTLKKRFDDSKCKSRVGG